MGWISIASEPRNLRPRRRWAVRTSAVVLVWLSALGTAGSAAPATALDGLLRDLEITPLAGAAPPFVLPGLDTRRYALADLVGRPALLYFWATW